MLVIITFFTVFAVGIGLAYVLAKFRGNALNPNFLAGLGVAMMALLSVFRDVPPRDNQGITLTGRTKKGPKDLR